MNRRGESRARLGPSRRRLQVPGAPFPSRRPPCGVRPPSSWRRYPGGRAAGAPRNLFPHSRPARAGRPSPRPHRVPGLKRAPRLGLLPLPPARPPRPAALSPSRPLSSPALPGGRPCPSPRARFLLPPLTPLGPCLAAPRCPLASCHFGPRPLGPHPSGLAETARDRPRGPKSLAQSPQPCTLLARGRKNVREFGLLLLRKHSSAKIPRLAFSLFL